MTGFELQVGSTPLLVSMPHVGRILPDPLRSRLSGAALTLSDVDWHVDRLYAFAADLGASVLKATYARYVVDLNRPPDDASLYPGQATTGLCPLETFDGTPLYRDGEEPDEDERRHRLETYWRPYHEALRQSVEEIRARHGYALVYDAHSIRSRIPRLFQGELPAFNLGTGDGRTADPDLTAGLAVICAAHADQTTVVNGRFKGGYITRHYGDPAAGVHAVQMELAQRTYMDERPPFAFDADRASAVQATLRSVLQALLEWGRKRYG